MDIGNLLRIWHEIRSETLRNDVFRAFLFSNAKKNVFVGLYELTQLPIRKIINIAQKLKTIDSEIPFKGVRLVVRMNCFFCQNKNPNRYFFWRFSKKIKPPAIFSEIRISEK